MSRTPVTELLYVIYNESNQIGSRSYRKVNQAMQDGLTLAIRTGFKFEEGDFDYIDKFYGFSYWGRVDKSGTRGEEYYTLAIEENNITAAISFESYKARPPFIYLGRRLAVGSEFVLPTREEGQIWKVNSFTHSEGKTKINCGYYVLDPISNYKEKKLRSMKAFTRKELKEQEKIYKEAINENEQEVRFKLEKKLEINNALPNLVK